MATTTKVIPIEIDRVKILLTVEISDPRANVQCKDFSVKGRQGRRLPAKKTEEIEALLEGGARVADVVKATGISAPTVYMIRTRMRQEGRIKASAFNSNGPRRPKDLQDDMDGFNDPDDALFAGGGEDDSLGYNEW